MARKKQGIQRPEEIGTRYADKIDKMVNNWVAAKPTIVEEWQKKMNQLLAEHGGVKPQRVENLRVAIDKITPERYREALNRGAQVIVRNWVRALAVSPRV
ncbi:MAG: hypothetical protein QXQ91_01265 [Nanopusillaceae archaeon]